MTGNTLLQYRRVSLFFGGWLGLLKLAVAMPLLVYVTLLLVLPGMSSFLSAYTGEPLTLRWLFARAPGTMWTLFLGSIPVGWIYFWCERRLFLRLLGPPEVDRTGN